MSTDYKTQYSSDKNINTLERGSYNDWGDLTPAKQVLARQPDGDVYKVEVVGKPQMKCEKGVFNLIAGLPLTITPNTIYEICDVTFYQDDGARIFIQYRNLVTSIEVCTKKMYANLEYKIEGSGEPC